MKLLSLEDLKNMDEAAIKSHLAKYYNTEEHNNNYENYGKEDPVIESQLKDLKVLLAYESVGDYGCDSSSFFIFKNQKTGKLLELHGSHCSCYGFEGQFSPEETTAAALKLRANNGMYFTGGYDYNEEQNKKLVTDFINNLPEEA